MDGTQYRDAAVENRRKHGFEPVDEDTNEFDPGWERRDDDDSIEAVAVLATLVDDEPDPSLEDFVGTADSFRDVLVDRVALSLRDRIVDLRVRTGRESERDADRSLSAPTSEGRTAPTRFHLRPCPQRPRPRR